jgi:hypothetical protein
MPAVLNKRDAQAGTVNLATGRLARDGWRR